ncbi:S-adenosyl-L-methionine-dependent methyltransferase [Amanita muscaria]
MSQLRVLLAHITNAVDALEKACAVSGTRIPELNEPFNLAAENLINDPPALEAAGTISAAALQMHAILSTPRNAFFYSVGGQWKSAALRTALESHSVEILREAGPKGLHVNDIAAKTGIDAQKLGRCLRLLATHHIFRELKPEVFTNTRLSSMFDTHKSAQEILANPDQKFVHTNGIASHAGHILDEHFKSSAFQWEAIRDPEIGKGGDPANAPFGVGVSGGKDFWSWVEHPDRAYSHRRFDIAMRGLLDNTPVIAMDWKSLPQNTLVVDVGGGVGSATLAIARAYPHLKVIIQDRAPVVENGLEVWKKEFPEAIQSGRVQFQVHNFLTAQPQKNADVFFLKHVLHDWSDEFCYKILKPLREAATPKTRLVIVEIVIPYACHDPKDGSTSNIVDSAPQEAPEPLLANWGIVNQTAYSLDMAMLNLVLGQERTIGQFDRLLTSAGWKIVAVHRQPGIDVAVTSGIEAVPI